MTISPSSLEYVHQQHWYQTMPLHLTRRAADSGTTVHTWSLDTLARLYRTNPALRSKILVLLSIDLVRKLQRSAAHPAYTEGELRGHFTE